jgi:hypothetical protein
VSCATFGAVTVKIYQACRIVTQKNVYRIGDVTDVHTRSLLRGLLTKKVDEKTFSTLNHLRIATTKSNIEIVSKLLLNDSLFRHLKFTTDFPELPAVAGPMIRLADQSLEKELTFQSLRIAKHADRLSRALEDLRVINDHLLGGSSVQAVEAIEKFIEDYGYSLLILSKLAYVNAQFRNDERISKTCAEHLELYGVGRRNAIALSAIDMMGTSYEFVTLRRNLLDFANSKIATEFTRDIVNWQFRPIRFAGEDLASQLQSHGLSSILDALVFIFIHRHNVGIFDDLRLSHLVDRHIPAKLRKKWLQVSEGKGPAESILFDADEPEFADYSFYRRSLAWIEHKSVSIFRNGIDPLYVENTSTRISHHAGTKFVKRYFGATKRLVDIAAAPENISININHYRNKEAGVFSRTVAFVHLLRHGAKSNEITADQLLTLLNWTRDVSLIATIDELREFFVDGAKDGIAQYLANAVIADCSRLNIDQHRLRRQLQELIITQFSGDIILFADFLAKKSKQVANHFFALCTEAFLAQLFFLLPNSELIFETRARLLDWFADTFDEQAYRDRARALRLDEKLRKVRGEMDDARIYVDPLRYGQWLDDNALDELSGLFRGGEITEAAINDFKMFGNFAENRQPHMRLAIVLQAAFFEFCSNKRYGVDSYLGRRIRHGTLKGVMLAQLRTIFDKQKYRLLIANRNVYEVIESWLSAYEAQILKWGQEIFQVASKAKPNGQIVPDITTPSKLEFTRAALKDLVQTFRETNNLAVVNLSIFEWCWRILEKDLSAIRATIDVGRSTWGSLNRRTIYQECTEEQRGLATELCREINSLTDEKFRSLSRWFTKPTNLAPSANLSLLLDAVLSEVQDQFPDYRPTITRVNVSDLELVGMYYHHVYDFLSVVIYNAGKHGDRKGLLIQTVKLSDVENGVRRVEIIISSQINRSDSLSDVRRNIDAAMSGSIEDAMVIEGRSGLKKLLRLSSDVKEITSIDASYEGDIVSVRCELRLPVG